MLSKFSVTKVYTVFVGVIIVIILGIISFINMSTDLIPSLEFPYVLLLTTYPGAAPEQVESNVTKVVEKSMSTINNIKKIQSISSENVSMIMLEFEGDTNMDTAVIEVNNSMDLIESTWTDDMIGSTVITKINPNMLPIMLTAVDSNKLTREELSILVNEELTNELESTEGVASVTANGLISEKIEVKLNQDKIDKINDLLLKGVNKKLASTSNKLYSARNKINKGKEELSTMTNTQLTEIISGISQIEDGISKLDFNINTNTNKKTELLGEIQKINEAIADKTKEIETIDAQIEEINNDSTMSLFDKNAEITRLTTEKNTINDELTTVNGSKTTKLSEIDKVTALINGLNSTKEELLTQKKSLSLTKSLMLIKISETSSSLLSAESKINEGIESFKTARKEALENANVDGIITQSMISNILFAENFSMPAGTIKEDEESIIVKVGDKFSSIDEIKNLTLFSYDMSGLSNVTLDDVADVSMKIEGNDSYVKINNNDGILLTMQKQSTSSTAEACDSANEKLDELREKYPDLTFTNLMDQGVYIDMIISSVLENLLYGAILAIIVLLLFLKDYKPTLAISLSIPISLTFAIALMYFTGVTINIISLSGLALGVGMLVDNSIVVIENIYRLRREGMSARDAAIYGANEVAGAVIASTLTTVCVFVPIVFVTGVTKQLFADMGLTIAYSLLASLIVSLTLVPAIASGVFKNVSIKENHLLNKIIEKYRKVLNNVLNKKVLSLIGVTVLLVVSVILVFNMGTEFIPQAAGTEMTIDMQTESTVKTKDKKEMADELVKRIESIEDIITVGAIDSTSLSMMNTGSGISFYLMLKEKDREFTNEEVKAKILELTSDLDCKLTVNTSGMDMSMLSSSGITVNVEGSSIDDLIQTADDIKNIFEKVKGIDVISDSIGETKDELRVSIDKNKSMKYGLTTASIYSLLSADLTEEKESTDIMIDSKTYPLVVLKQPQKNITTTNLKDYIVTGKEDEKEIDLKLSKIASIETKKSLSSITRSEFSRTISVSASIKDNYNIKHVSEEFEKLLNKYETKGDIKIELSGENETINDAIGDLLIMILLAVVLIYLIMVAQFQSVKHPFIVMFTLPLAFTGGLLGLVITGSTLSIIALIGFLILAGVVVNNAIVFIDYTNILRSRGKNIREALIEAGATRLKPILMTALTTILSLTTLALGIGSGTEMIRPLGIVTIFGLIYSTFLTLFIIPCVYELFNKDKKNK